MRATRSAVVIGAGIAGPVAAIALRKAGIAADVYEAYPGPADGIGGPVVLHQNGLLALDIVAVGDAVRVASPAWPGTVVYVAGRRLGEQPRPLGTEPRRIIERGTLYRLVREAAQAAGVRFVYGRRLIGADEQGQKVIARFSDGSAATGDVLVGADGVNSTVRTLIDPHAPSPKYTGLLGFGGYADNVDVPEPTGVVTLNFGQRAYYVYWTFPDGRIGWFAAWPSRKPLTLPQVRSIPSEEWLHKLRKTYAGDVPGEQLMSNTNPESLSANGPLRVTRPVPHWSRSRMVLVGDAIHAPSNGTGQGVSLAVESAIQLARCLRDLPDPDTAFGAYDALRRERVQRIVLSGEQVNRAMASGPVGRFLMRRLGPLLFRRIKPDDPAGLEMLYRIDWDAPVVTSDASSVHGGVL